MYSSLLGWSAGAALAALALSAAARAGEGQTFTIDASASHGTVDVGKSGPFSFAAGHAHEVNIPAIEGTIVADLDDLTRSTLRLTIDARRLQVTGKGEPAKDVPEVQRIMLSEKVLDVDRFPSIAFRSERVSITTRSSDEAALVVSGVLTLHGVERPAKSAARVRFVDQTTLTAAGRLQVKQTDYGIKPVSVGGLVSVKDALDITFSIVARR